MIRSGHHADDRASEEAYLELVASLFETRMPAVIMSVLFLIVAGIVAFRSPDWMQLSVVAAGAVASAVRLTVLFVGRSRIDAGTLTAVEARGVERWFGVSYVSFAAVFGCFAAHALTLPLPALHLPVGILVVGYAAGVAATVSLRPAIALPSLLVSVLPPTVVLGMGPDLEHIAAATCLAALLSGGLRSLSRRHGIQTAQFARSRRHAVLAHRDHLTGLANRLALAEAIERSQAAAPATLLIAVHYMDLDDFKLVNDHLGHAAGDSLLRAVATRLLGEASETDMVVRIGGDEFAFVQTEFAFADEVAERARAIEAALAAPFEIDGRAISISVSVGSSWACGIPDLPKLLGEADDALRARKRERKARRQATAPARSCATSIGRELTSSVI